MFTKLHGLIQEEGINLKIDETRYKGSKEGMNEVAYFQVVHQTKEFNIGIGSFIFEEENVIPIIALAHELGHFYDFKYRHRSRLVSFQATYILQREINAWELAVYIMHDLGFNQWETFYKYAEYCLGTYYRDYFWGSRFRYNYKQALDLLVQHIEKLGGRLNEV